MAYTAVSKCRINGKSFFPGDIIPPGEMLPYEAARLEKLKLIMQIDDPDVIKLYDDVDAFSKEDIFEIIHIVTATAADAVKAISDLSRADIGIITAIQRIDKREKVANACAGKLEEISENAEETE